MNDAPIHSSTSSIPPSYLTTAYSELCRSYQGLHEFRMKLLGLLPIASVVGLLALVKALQTALPQSELQAEEAIGYIGIFSGIFTLALFGYEVRSLLMCHDYSVTGARLEAAMGIRGQFTRCDERRHFACYQGKLRHPLARLVNDKVTSTLVYSFVFSSWFFAGLKWTFDMQTHQCVLWAVSIGTAAAAAALLFLNMLTQESKRENLLVNHEAVFVVVARQ